MTGQTLLPMPMGIEQVFEEEWKAQRSGGVEVDVRLKSDIETIVTKWCSQIGDVLKEESTRAFLNDKQPLPSEGIMQQYLNLARFSEKFCIYSIKQIFFLRSIKYFIAISWNVMQIIHRYTILYHQLKVTQFFFFFSCYLFII